uniref:Uncharacterized protein n=1 Tax=Anopheles atroparvus TaxID=41427 RepID=A0AAG5CRZ8_ANOAO
PLRTFVVFHGCVENLSPGGGCLILRGVFSHRINAANPPARPRRIGPPNVSRAQPRRGYREQSRNVSLQTVPIPAAPGDNHQPKPSAVHRAGKAIVIPHAHPKRGDEQRGLLGVVCGPRFGHFVEFWFGWITERVCSH